MKFDEILKEFGYTSNPTNQTNTTKPAPSPTTIASGAATPSASGNPEEQRSQLLQALLVSDPNDPDLAAALAADPNDPKTLEIIKLAGQSKGAV